MSPAARAGEEKPATDGDELTWGDDKRGNTATPDSQPDLSGPSSDDNA